MLALSVPGFPNQAPVATRHTQKAWGKNIDTVCSLPQSTKCENGNQIGPQGRWTGTRRRKALAHHGEELEYQRDEGIGTPRGRNELGHEGGGLGHAVGKHWYIMGKIWDTKGMKESGHQGEGRNWDTREMGWDAVGKHWYIMGKIWDTKGMKESGHQGEGMNWDTREVGWDAVGKHWYIMGKIWDIKGMNELGHQGELMNWDTRGVDWDVVGEHWYIMGKI